MSWPDVVRKVGKNSPLPMRRSLTKSEILRTKREIDRLFRSGKRVTVNGAKLVYTRNDRTDNRVFVTLVRKYGNAVQRNRAKRIAKEVYRNHKSIIQPGWDLGFILFPGKDGLQARETQIIALITKARALLRCRYSPSPRFLRWGNRQNRLVRIPL